MSRIRTDNTKEIEASAAKYCLWNHKNNSEFRFVDSPVLAGHELSTPICKATSDQETDDRSEEGASVCIACVDLVPEQRRSDKDRGKHNSNENCPANHSPLQKTSPQDGRMREKGEGSKE